MTEKEMPPKKEDDAGKQSESSAPAARGDHKHRRHGYRGYPNNPEVGGDIHVGTGFAGIGPVGGTSSSRPSILGDKTRKSVEDLEEDGK